MNIDKYIVDIKGKKYLTVAGRIMLFWDEVSKDPEKLGSIMTEVKQDGNLITTKAIAAIGLRVATGHASEIVGDGNINSTSALENCESSAVGRALGNLGFGLLDAGGVASADEVQGAIAKQNGTTQGASSTPGVGVKMATIPQHKLIRKLLAEKGLSIPDQSHFDSLTGLQAKTKIDTLLGKTVVQPKIVTEDDQTVPPHGDADFLG